VNRRLLKSDLWLSEPFTRGQAWVDLVGHARWKAGFVRIRGQQIDLERGQLAVSECFIAEKWKWSRGKVRRFLNELKTDHRIEHRTTNVTTVVTILNYDRYQGGDTADGTADGQRTDSGRTADGHIKERLNSLEGLEGLDDDGAAAGSVLDIIRDFAIAWNTTKGCQKADEETIRRLAANGRASGFRDEGWLQAYPRALQKFPLRYFKSDVAVGQFLQGDFVWNVLAGMYQTPAGGPPAKADAPAGMVPVSDALLWQKCPESLRKGKPGKSDLFVNSAWLESQNAKAT